MVSIAAVVLAGVISFSIHKSDLISADLLLYTHFLFTAFFHEPKPFGGKEGVVDKIVPNLAESKISYGLSIRRLRFDLMGHYLTEALNYRVQMAFEGQFASLLDAHIDYKLSDIVKLRIGQYKVPFDREELTPEGEIEFAERSVVNQYFTLGRDIGCTMTIGSQKARVNLGAFTGWGRGYLRVDPVLLNKNMLYVFRAEIAPFGRFTYSQANLRKERALNIGLAGLYFPISQEEMEAKKIAGRRDKSDVLKEIEGKATKTVLLGLSGDIKLWWDQLSFETELDWANFHNISLLGIRLQPSYMISEKLGLAIRFASVIREKSSPVYEPAISLTYYFKDLTKLQIDYTNRRDIQKGKDKFAYLKAQFQLYIK